MNTKLLRRVKRVVLAEPKRLDMDMPLSTDPTDAPASCGTAGCIAGWALVLGKRKGREPMKAVANALLQEGGEHRWLYIEPRARKLLGLTKRQALRLFHDDYWPEPFQREFCDARWGTKESAQVCARRIDHFIRTKGRE